MFALRSITPRLPLLALGLLATSQAKPLVITIYVYSGSILARGVDISVKVTLDALRQAEFSPLLWFPGVPANTSGPTCRRQQEGDATFTSCFNKHLRLCCLTLAPQWSCNIPGEPFSPPQRKTMLSKKALRSVFRPAVSLYDPD